MACDLSAVLDDDAPGAIRALAAAGRHVRAWPGIPVAVAGIPSAEEARLDLNERLVALVADPSRAWGVLPTADGGRLVWAVFDAHREQFAGKPVV